MKTLEKNCEIRTRESYRITLKNEHNSHKYGIEPTWNKNEEGLLEKNKQIKEKTIEIQTKSKIKSKKNRSAKYFYTLKPEYD